MELAVLARDHGSVTAMRTHVEHAQSHARGRPSYCFGEFELDLCEGELRRNGQLLAVTKQSLSVLAYLVLHRGRTVSRQELVRAVWGDVRVASGSLSQAVWEIRRTLDPQKGSSIIRTARRMGYRFVAQVELRAAAPSAPTSDQAAICFCPHCGSPHTFQPGAPASY
jgi:DNA-binding winged helix-turn-helix (wHTH) protein